MGKEQLRTAPRRARFLDALGRLGNVTHACEAVDISRAAAYAWKNEDADFAAAWQEALDLGVCGLEDHALALAAGGSEKLTMFLLSANKPEKYMPQSRIDFRGTMDVRQHSRATLPELRQELAGLLAMAKADPALTAMIEGTAEDVTNITENVINFPTVTD